MKKITAAPPRKPNPVRWFKRVVINRRIHKHNLKIAQNIGILFTDKLAKDRNFRRTMSSAQPNLMRRIDQEIQQIKNVQ